MRNDYALRNEEKIQSRNCKKRGLMPSLKKRGKEIELSPGVITGKCSAIA
jgi:hypothetical protein